MRSFVAVLPLALLTTSCVGGRDDGAAAPSTTSAAPSTGAAQPAGGPGTATVQGGGFARPDRSPALLTGVRAGDHDASERVVWEFAEGRVPGYRVSYVEPPIRGDGSGATVEVDGSAFLQVQMAPAGGVDVSGAEPRPTYQGPERLAVDGDVVTEVVQTGDFESRLTWTAGLTERAPFEVTQLADPARLVLDVLTGDSPATAVQPVGEGRTDDVAMDATGDPAVLTDVRLGAHDGFDRMVFEFAEGAGQPGWQVGYADRPTAPGSGAPVDVPGRAALGITLTGAALPGGAPSGVQPWDGGPRLSLPGTATLDTLVDAGLFEGKASFYAGLDGRQPFAVARLASPPRVVVDVLARDATAPMALTRRCDSAAGFAISYPEGWSANSGAVAPRCSRFDPDDIQLSPGTDARVSAVSATVEDAAFSRLATPDPAGEQSRAGTVVDGRQAVRIERIATGRGLFPEGTRQTSWLVDLSTGPDDGPGTLVVNTIGLPDFAYGHNVDVLDRMVRTLEITAGEEVPETVVARYEGGGGAFSVTAEQHNGEVCLQIPPAGDATCRTAPAADGVTTTSLPLVGERNVLAGIAGERVARVDAVRTGGGTVSVLPAPVPGAAVGGFAFSTAPAEIDQLRWYGTDGRELGHR